MRAAAWPNPRKITATRAAAQSRWPDQPGQRRPNSLRSCRPSGLRTAPRRHPSSIKPFFASTALRPVGVQHVGLDPAQPQRRHHRAKIGGHYARHVPAAPVAAAQPVAEFGSVRLRCRADGARCRRRPRRRSRWPAPDGKDQPRGRRGRPRRRGACTDAETGRSGRAAPAVVGMPQQGVQVVRPPGPQHEALALDAHPGNAGAPRPQPWPPTGGISASSLLSSCATASGERVNGASSA